MAPLDDGRILLIFRLDPGKEGDHVGANGFIAKITYDPERDTWERVETVYNWIVRYSTGDAKNGSCD